MDTEARLELTRTGQKRHYRHARDYGHLTNIGLLLADEQLAALRLLRPWAPVGEHVRRAIDAYLARSIR
jgi:hypothetical protein